VTGEQPLVWRHVSVSWDRQAALQPSSLALVRVRGLAPEAQRDYATIWLPEEHGRSPAQDVHKCSVGGDTPEPVARLHDCTIAS